ncbi:family 16 glycoside hydrolase, partial [Bacteroidota bacterium]
MHKKSSLYISYLILFICIILMSGNISAQQDVIDFDSEQWVKTNAKVVEHLGRKSLMGFAYLKDVEFENGIIEVDIATKAERSYPGILFRMQDFQNYERFYIRPHRQHLYSDAAQYVAAFNGIDSWQLYNGDGESSLIDIPPDQWNHLKIVVSGSQAKIYWIDMENPALEIPHLAHKISKGFLALNGPQDGTAYFSNFKFTKDDKIVFVPAEPIQRVVGAITDWEISRVFSIANVDLEKAPVHQGVEDLQWKKVKSDITGLVDISLHYSRLNPIGDCIFAKTTLTSEEDNNLEISFGYSDYITVFLNGEPIFFGGSAYRLRDPSFLGIVGYFDNLYLPLKKGENELMIIVAETFGGWAFQFRDENAVYQDPSLVKGWQKEREIQIPESVVYDKKRNICYVTSYYNGGREYISKMKLNGEVEKLEWITGLNRPTGMIIFNDKLYANDRRTLFEIDLEADSITNKYPIPGAKFPNDIAVDEEGNLYISDSQADAIYKFKNGNFETWLDGDEIEDPNGLLVDDDKLIVGVSSTGSVKSVDFKTKKIETIVSVGKSAIMDGLK